MDEACQQLFMQFFFRRTNYSDLPYNVRVNLLTLLLRQHIVIGHRELERFVESIKNEVSPHNWESILLGRLEELVAVPVPPAMNHTQKLTIVHLSENTVELIKKEWFGGCNRTSDQMAGVYNTTILQRMYV